MTEPPTQVAVGDDPGAALPDPAPDWLEGAAPFYVSARWQRLHHSSHGFASSYVAARAPQDSAILGLLPLHRLVADEPPPLLDLRQALEGAPTEILAGSRSGYDNRLQIRPQAPGRAERARELCEAALQHAADADARTAAWLYLPPADADALRDALPVPSQRFLCPPTALLPAAFSSFDEYVSCLPSSSRSIVRRDLRRMRESGIETTWHSFPDARLDAYPSMVTSVQRRHGDSVSEEAVAGYIEQFRREDFRDSTRFIEVRREGELAAFSFGVVHGGGLHLRVFGCDYDRFGDAREYFAASVYGPLEYAITHGLEFVHLGITSYRPKFLRGATLAARHGLVVSADGRTPPQPSERPWAALGDDADWLVEADLERMG